MSEANFNNTFKAVFPNGKTSTRPGEISDRYVTAICRIYEQRTDAEGDYVIEEYGIAERTALDNLSDCYAEASNVAYSNAISRLVGSAATTPTTLEELFGAASTTQHTIPKQEISVDTAPSSPQDDTSNTLANDFLDDTDTDDFADDSGNADALDFANQSQNTDTPTVQKLDLDKGLPVAASTTDAEIEAARAVEITIVGKAHDSYKWTAGRILDETPEVLVNFATHYKGDKNDEKNALMTLYPEALRKLQKAAYGTSSSA